MKTIRFINNTWGKFLYWLFLPIFGDHKTIYSIKCSDWWAWYASDTKRWIFEKGEYKI
jgi:hypothetical protein